MGLVRNGLGENRLFKQNKTKLKLFRLITLAFPPFELGTQQSRKCNRANVCICPPVHKEATVCETESPRCTATSTTNRPVYRESGKSQAKMVAAEQHACILCHLGTLPNLVFCVCVF